LTFKASVALLAVEPDAVEPAAAAAAEVVLLAGPHFPEVFGNVAHDLPGAVAEAGISHVVARILVGHRLLDLFGRVDFQLSGAQGLGHPLHIVETFNRCLALI
jgi:hypothetical protein